MFNFLFLLLCPLYPFLPTFCTIFIFTCHRGLRLHDYAFTRGRTLRIKVISEKCFFSIFHFFTIYDFDFDHEMLVKNENVLFETFNLLPPDFRHPDLLLITLLTSLFHFHQYSFYFSQSFILPLLVATLQF